jgi:hypothetical protein
MVKKKGKEYCNIALSPETKARIDRVMSKEPYDSFVVKLLDLYEQRKK